MGSFNGIERERDARYNLPQKTELSINAVLPPELFEKALSNLDDESIRQASLVNHCWKHAAIETVRSKKLMIKFFAEFLGENLQLKSYPNQRKKLLEIESDLKISASLIQIRSSTYKMKENILNILKTLEEKDLKSLKELSKDKTPKFFENIFDLVRIYQRLDQANQIRDNGTKSSTLWDISEMLEKIGEIEKSIKVVSTIADDDRRKYAVLLLERGEIDKSIKVANTITDNGMKSTILQDISKMLEETFEIEKSIKVASMIPNDDIKSYTLAYIVRGLVKKVYMNRALEVVERISKHNIRIDTMEYISAAQSYIKKI